MSSFDEMIVGFANRAATLRSIPKSEILIGCSEEEIKTLEADYRLELPEAYRSFLRHVGRSAEDLFFIGTDSSFERPCLLRCRDIANRLMCPEFALPQDAFVFLLHQGYQFCYFRCGLGDNPAVLFLREHKPPPRELAPSFTDYLALKLRNFERLSMEDQSD